MFWRIVLQSKIWPRYINGGWKQNVEIGDAKESIQTGPPEYTWSFKVTLITSQKVVLAESTTHKLTKIQEDQGRNETVFVMEQSQKPYHDFTFIYTTEKVEKPTHVLSTTDTSQTLLVSFIPRFNDLELTDAEKMEREGKDYEVSMADCQGEFVFILDRSGSMGGQRIEGAKNALIFFLKSLPTNSIFNIVSFGSKYTMLHKGSTESSTKNVEKSISEIKKFGADMGGTEI